MLITLEKPRHAAAVEALLDIAFGPERTRKTTYRLRDGIDAISDLCYVALETGAGGNDIVVGTIRFWPVLIGGTEPSLMLGPIAVAPHLQGHGLGSKLIRIGLNKAFALGYRSVILVGDAPYYRRFGFTRALTLGMHLPGPVDLDRFLALELVDGALAGVGGMVERALPAKKPAAKAMPLANPAPVYRSQRRRTV
jgi:predicted N-acetyltransferase YhbS